MAALTSGAGASVAHDLQGRTALVTGAAGPVGRRFCGRLLDLGAIVVMVDHPDSDLVALGQELAEVHERRVVTAPVDLAGGDAVQRVAEALPGGPVDVLVNNAALTGTSGVGGYAVPFDQQTVEAFDRALHLNLTVPFALTRLVRQDLVEGRGAASIVNIASIYGLVGPQMALYEGTTMGNPAAYAASKGGLVQLTRYLATVLAPHVRVNALAPGGVHRGQAPEFVERYERLTPLGRMATEEDLLGTLTWLVTDASAYVTGQVVAVDGGWTSW